MGRQIGFGKFDPFDLLGRRKAREDAHLANVAEQAKLNADLAKEEEPVKDLKEDKAATKDRRVNLFATAGGITGQELSPDQVGKRKNLLGN